MMWPVAVVSFLCGFAACGAGKAWVEGDRGSARHLMGMAAGLALVLVEMFVWPRL